jgi:ABC-type Zn uptake system ZnuABC Zn-binding protein ZnuA
MAHRKKEGEVMEPELSKKIRNAIQMLTEVAETFSKQYYMNAHEFNKICKKYNKRGGV